MKSSDYDDIKKFVFLYQATRKITTLARGFLYILEDARDDYNIPDEKFSRYRKRVLDSSNDAIRDIESNSDEIKLQFK